MSLRSSTVAAYDPSHALDVLQAGILLQPLASRRVCGSQRHLHTLVRDGCKLLFRVRSELHDPGESQHGQTYRSEDIADLLQSRCVYGVRLTALQYCPSRVHPSQGGGCSEVDLLGPKSPHGGIHDDPAVNRQCSPQRDLLIAGQRYLRRCILSCSSSPRPVLSAWNGCANSACASATHRGRTR